MTQERCETCRFAHINWRKGDIFQQTTGYGYSPPTEAQRPSTSVQCRRHAPTKAFQENDTDGWPWICGDDWCGEYQERPQ